MLWVGLSDDKGHLQHLGSSTKDALRDLVITEDRPFRAARHHRAGQGPVRLPPAAREVAVEPVRFDMDDAPTLIRSHLGGGAPARYEALGRWHLGAPTP